MEQSATCASSKRCGLAVSRQVSVSWLFLPFPQNFCTCHAQNFKIQSASACSECRAELTETQLRFPNGCLAIRSHAFVQLLLGLPRQTTTRIGRAGQESDFLPSVFRNLVIVRDAVTYSPLCYRRGFRVRFRLLIKLELNSQAL